MFAQVPAGASSCSHAASQHAKRASTFMAILGCFVSPPNGCTAVDAHLGMPVVCPYPPPPFPLRSHHNTCVSLPLCPATPCMFMSGDDTNPSACQPPVGCTTCRPLHAHAPYQCALATPITLIIDQLTGHTRPAERVLTLCNLQPAPQDTGGRPEPLALPTSGALECH